MFSCKGYYVRHFVDSSAPYWDGWTIHGENWATRTMISWRPWVRDRWTVIRCAKLAIWWNLEAIKTIFVRWQIIFLKSSNRQSHLLRNQFEYTQNSCHELHHTMMVKFVILSYHELFYEIYTQSAEFIWYVYMTGIVLLLCSRHSQLYLPHDCWVRKVVR